MENKTDNKNVVNKKELVKKLLKQEISAEDESDLLEMLIDRPITIDVDKQEEAKMTRGDRIADKVSEIAGSWGFILGFSSFLIFWVILNSVVLKGELQIDEYPFILLNLLLSCLAALQAPVIMMSQNRQAAKDSLRNQNDYRTDLKSELILEDLHTKMEEILRNQRKILRIIDQEEEENSNK